MYKTIAFLTILATPLGQPQSKKAYLTNDEVQMIFGAAPSNETLSTTTPMASLTDTTGNVTCTTNTGDPGTCVLYYLCPNDNIVIAHDIGVIDISLTDGPCQSYLDICCKNERGTGQGEQGSNRPATPPPTRRPPPASPAPTPQPLEGCGRRNPYGVGFRIIGDKNGESQFGEFPWMVAILKDEPITNKYQWLSTSSSDEYYISVAKETKYSKKTFLGGGSLIHPSVVLTAAFFGDLAQEITVRAGEWDVETTKEIYPYQDREIKKIIIHEDYNEQNLYYNIALMFLFNPMDPAPNVGVVCLPPPNERARGGTRCVASGWGKHKFGKEGYYQYILKKVELPAVEHGQCESALRTTRLSRYFQLHSSFMCAGGERGKDTCKGDGGAPLVCPTEINPDRYQQNGIVAWGIGCGEDGIPGVYTDVATLRPWIDQHVKAEGYSIDVQDIISQYIAKNATNNLPSLTSRIGESNKNTTIYSIYDKIDDISQIWH